MSTVDTMDDDDDGVSDLEAIARRTEPFASVPMPGESAAAVLENTSFRRVLHTDEDERIPEEARVQQVAMALRAGESIGWEAHGATTQLFLVVAGTATFYRGGAGVRTPRQQAKREQVTTGSFWEVPAGTWHDVEAVSDLRLLTVYVPPLHAYGTRNERRPT